MTIAAYAYETNEARRAHELVNENSTLTIEGNDLVIDDGKTKKVIDFDTFNTYDPFITTSKVPIINDGTVQYINSTVDASLVKVLNVLIELLKSFRFDDNIKCLKNLVMNEKQILGVAGSSNDVHLMTLEYYNEHKDELKGEKGDTGPQGPQGIQGPQGENGLDGEDGKDGKTAKSWIWNLINTGLTAASYGVLQYQIGKIWAVLGEEVLDDVKNALNFISNGSDTIKTLSGWMQETRSQIDTVRRIANNARTGLDTLREAQNTLKEANDILGSVSDMHEDWLKGIDKSLKNHSQSIADYKKSIDFLHSAMDVHDGSIRNLLNANNNLPGTIKAFIKSFVKPGALTFRSLRARALKSRDAETPTEPTEGTETTETPEEPPKPTANEILFEYFPRYSVLIAYIQEILKKADLTLGDDESSVYLSFQFQIAELLRQICLMYDNISDFTRYDDDHDPEHGEEEVLQTSIKTGKVLTQSLIIDTKDGEVDVLQELKKNTSSGGGGRHELEINEIEEKLAEKADKNHVHYISSDEQIITDYHGYLTQDEQISTEDVNERRYKFIRAKGYDIHCTVQYDTGKAPEAFGYNNEIYASYFFVNGVLVEPRFTLRVKAKITFEDAIKSKADKDELDATNKVLKSHKHNISDINELQATLNSKADKNHTHESFTTVRADDIILNYTLGSSAPLENPSTSVKDTLNSLNSKCMNIEGHVRNFETHELPAMLDKKADKEHTHNSFSTVAIESIEGTVGGTGGDALYYKPPNFPQGLTSNENITTKKEISCKNVYVMDDENNVKFTAQDLYDKKADKTELQTLKTEILQTLYPIGSIYTSMNSTNPASVLGFGTWQQIVDKFLYCANSSKQTGGSKKITEANLPAHTHTGTTNFSGDHSHSLRDHPLYNSDYKAGNDVLSPSYNNSAKKTFRPTEPGGNHSHTFTTNPTGSGEDYMPPFMTVYAWYRVQ
ncbi:organellar and viral DNA polymerase type B [Trichomonas vaginalis G3]|uniref:organellar and viral DNA polymerase type B n=2 Tax=Trichomonas vaginalis (strain ATCC PRA-98 / G3) TaxID=412133 RepID=UPI0021E5BA1E|nr:organellar and viral DNA polymerase type B [Trichomonas vaginalis G3]KAI5551368.1 organellar and viral DNA polymerase type B [Trichomonas vaginalis G3]